jgi:glycosyltransferase involved in cell wall biosynthesis
LESQAPKRSRSCPAAYARNSELHDYFRQPERGLPHELIQAFFKELGGPKGLSRSNFLHSKESWEQIKDSYHQHCTDPSFVDYFWTIRSMHTPLFFLADLARSIRPCKAFHSVSTGYAGFVGAMLRHLHSRPLILTEHGIYTKERKIDLFQAPWIKDTAEVFSDRLDDDIGYLRRLWIRFFEGLGRIIYDAADPIVSLFEANRERQITDGASRERTQVVPNGVDVARFAVLRSTRTDPAPPIVGLIGRIVPIKDIQTFIRAMRLVCSRIPAAEGWVIGPEEENPGYADECKNLVHQLGLQGKVKFLGFRRPEELLPRLGLLCLTSISEGLPLVVLEGFASGVPAVTTNVGSCAQLIQGVGEADRALGEAGALVSIANPQETAAAIVRLLQDAPGWKAAQSAGIQRVEKFYTQGQMFQSYRDIYRQAIDS